MIDLRCGNNLDLLPTLPDCSIDACVCDPPYELGFMGRTWDSSGIAYNVDLWRQVLRVLKPGGHLVAFGGTRTYHRMTCAIEDAGFEIRDCLGWLYGSGFPKSKNVALAIDKSEGHPNRGKAIPTASRFQNGTETLLHSNPVEEYVAKTDAAKQWQGWGTALKPAWEPAVLARKPLDGTVAANVLAHGCGALNVDGCRVGTEGGTAKGSKPQGDGKGIYGAGLHGACEIKQLDAGRWPANILHDGSDEAEAVFPDDGGGSASRFFYSAKTSVREREAGLDDMPRKTAGELNGRDDETADQKRANIHPTVKPIKVMQWLIRLVTPSGGVVLDPFTGSGSTGMAAMLEGFSFIGFEIDSYYFEIAKYRIEFARKQQADKQNKKEQSNNAHPAQIGLFKP